MSRLCPFCNSNKSSIFSSFQQGEQYFNVAMCEICGFRYTLNPPKATVSHGVNKKRANSFHRRYYLIKNLMEKKLEKGARIAEIGAGFGQLGKLLQTRFEYLGYEPSQERCDLSASIHGVTLIPDFFNNESVEDHSLDAIILDNVLEHVEQPTDIIQLCKTKLKKSGILVTIVPNYFDIRRFSPKWRVKNHLIRAHINYFTASTLVQMLNKNSFKPHFMGPNLISKECISSLPELIPHAFSAPVLGLYLYSTVK